MDSITRQCTLSGKPFVITEKEQKFYVKLAVPLPTLCPEERQRRRLAWRNERFLYRATSAKSGKPIISMYHPSSPYIVYDQTEWWSDDFDPLEYGQVFDFGRTFLEQFKELQHRVPRINLINTNSENSEYTNYTANNKNCYLVFSNSFGHNEDCAYGTCLQSSKDCIDSIHITQCELTKGCIDCIECFRLVDSQDCERCSESFFLIDCRNCSYCYGCIGLRNKHYYFFNEQLTKEQYKDKLAAQNLSAWSGYSLAKQKAEQFLANKPRIFSRQYNTEQCSGDYIRNSKNCHFAFDTSDSEDVSYTHFCVKGEHDSMDVAYLGGGELSYDCLSIVEGYNCMFTNIAWWNVARLTYCDLCFHSQDVFGCIGLKRHQYCILNTQYTQEEYKKMIPRIIEHMKKTGEYGEFFPIEMSPFSYNETVAYEYFPLSRHEAAALGMSWREPEPVIPVATTVIPDDINDLEDAVDRPDHEGNRPKGADSSSNEPNSAKEAMHELVLECEESHKPFRVTELELSIYKALNIAIPRLNPDIRREGMMNKRNPRQLWERNCMKCGAHILTSYHQDNPHSVYCEECYMAQVN